MCGFHAKCVKLTRTLPERWHLATASWRQDARNDASSQSLGIKGFAGLAERCSALRSRSN